MEIRPALPDGVPVGNDVQQIPLSEFQGGQLANNPDDPAVSFRDRNDGADREVLSMDGGDHLPPLPPLRRGPAIPAAETPARDRGRDRRGNACGGIDLGFPRGSALVTASG